MPLTKEKRKKYPDGWKLLSLKLIEERAKNHCEICGKKRTQGKTKYEPRVTLTVAHLDHNEANNELWNLKVMCGGCHLRYDKEDNMRRRRKNRYTYNTNQLLLLTITVCNIFIFGSW